MPGADSLLTDNHMNIKVFTAVFLAIFFWGFSFVWTNQILMEDIPVFTFIFFRMFIAGTLLYLFSKFTGKLQKIEKGDYKLLFLMAFFEPFIYFIGETFGLQATNSPTLSALIIALIPVFALGAGVFIYKEKVTWINLLGVIATIPGILLMVLNTGDMNPEYWWGIALLFLAIFGSVGYSTVVKRLSRYNSFTIATYQFVFGAILFLPCFLIFNGDYQVAGLFEWNILKPILYLAVLCSCLSFVLYIFSIKSLGIARSSVFTSLIPAVSAVGAYIYGYETFTWQQILGIVIVILGVAITQKQQ